MHGLPRLFRAVADAAISERFRELRPHADLRLKSVLKTGTSGAPQPTQQRAPLASEPYPRRAALRDASALAARFCSEAG